MYLNILKKDLKNKKVMNIILLVFIILATMFVSSSANNILCVTTALDNYMEIANVPDLFITTLDRGGSVDVEQILSSTKAVKNYKIEEIIFFGQSEIKFSCLEKDDNEMISTFFVQGDLDMHLNFFLEDGSVLEKVNEGEFYINTSYVEKLGIKKGDTLTLTKGDLSCDFVCAGIIKDAVFGSSSGSATARCILSENDFQKFADDESTMKSWGGKTVYIETDDPQAVINDIYPLLGGSFIAGMDKSDVKTFYIFDMIVTGIILVVSAVLIAVAFMVLKFSITYTLSEEYREIGVMKALGISNNKIRGLYIVKYVAIAIIGALVGFGLSFPFGDFLATMASQSIVLGGTNPAYINAICAVIVVGIIVLFCFGCTSKVRKLTPIDAIHNGQTGERFRKKSIMSLSKSKLNSTAFLAINDVVSSPKRFVTITITVFLCVTLALMMSTVVYTMKDGSLVKFFGMAEGHVGIADNDSLIYLQSGGREILQENIDEIERILAENGMPAQCSTEIMFTMPISFGEGENACASYGNAFYQGTGTTMDDYEYTKGTAPRYANEVAITKRLAETLGADIGDTITVEMSDGNREYVITAFMQVMNGAGYCVRFHTDENIDYSQAHGIFVMVVKFTDNPSQKEIERRIEKMEELDFEVGKVKELKEFAEEAIGIVDTLEYVQMFITILTVILVVMLTVLLEISFIAKEKSEIALMKATGMKSGKIIGQHVLRFVFVAVIVVLLAWILALPMTHLCIDPVFKMMGMELAIDYNINTLEMFVVFPAIILVSTTLSATLTALMTKKIKPADTASIE